MDLIEGFFAPDFCIQDFEGKGHCLKDFKGNWVVIYFYPKDMTPGCTKEACDFRDNFSYFEKNKVILLGISMDDEESHKKFKEKHNLNFPLLSDKDGNVSKEYGVLKEKNMYGKKIWGIERSTFIINPEGKIQKIWRKVKVDGHIKEVIDFLSPQLAKN